MSIPESPNPRASPTRPLSATIIAWVWIGFSVLGIQSSLNAYRAEQRLAAARPTNPDPKVAAFLDRVEANFIGSPLETGISIALSIVSILGAIGLLRMRSWGRRILIAVTWLALVITFIAVPYVILEITNLVVPAEEGAAAFRATLWIVGLAQIFTTTLICGLMLRSLHSKRLREAVR